jgi:hypothetical protein
MKAARWRAAWIAVALCLALPEASEAQRGGFGGGKAGGVATGPGGRYGDDGWRADPSTPVREWQPGGRFNLPGNLHCGPNTMCGGDPAAPIVVPQKPAPVPKPKLKPASGVGEELRRKAIEVDKGGASLPPDLSFPFVVALLNSRNGMACSGTLISNRGHVLTAAHCFCDAASRPAAMRIGRSIFLDTPVASELRVTRELADEVQFLDEKYCAAKNGIDLAIAVTRMPLDLALDLTGSLHVVTPRTPHPDRNAAMFPLGYYLQMFTAGKPFSVVAVGFGASELQPLSGGSKRYASLSVLPCGPTDTRCEQFIELQARNPAGVAVDTCVGDSGGPLLEAGGTGQRTWRLFGVTSRAITGGKEQYCGSGGVYVSVLSLRVQNWLAGVVDAK